MDIWIIQDGEKTGPIHDFDVRKKIEHGELPASTPAWHEGLPAWRPLVEISLFEREFDRPFEAPETPVAPDEKPSASRSAPPLVPDNPLLIRRFFARWFDLHLFAGIWWITMWATGRDIGATLENAWIIFFQYIPWFALETFLLHRFGTTPGKWLLGLKLVNNNGSLLGLAEATRRSARVLFIGIGFGLLIVSLVCQIMAFFTTRRLGRSLWDQTGGHRLTATPLNPLRLVAFVFIFFASLQLQSIVVTPYNIEAFEKTDIFHSAVEKFPEFKEQFDNMKNSQWHLPKR